MNLIEKGKKIFRELPELSSRLSGLSSRADELKILTAKVLIQNMRAQGMYSSITDAEFKVFSQFGDDGIIQYLIRHIPVSSQTFVEFGVERYTESNTRFLLMNNNWKGLVMDSDARAIQFIQNDGIYWKYELTAVKAFIDKENINSLIADHGFAGELGILSIDIDGNDYWVWEAIRVANPTIVIAEYNSLFGSQHALTIPYDSKFERAKAHFSHLYWGCSLKALNLIAERKGYAFVGCNSSGNNAYFVRRDKLANVRALTVEQGYVRSRYRESRDAQGQLTYLSGPDRLRAISGMPVYDLEKECLTTLNEALCS